jgi:excisionase family DNA binding protein
MQSELLTVKELAAILRVGRDAAYKLVHEKAVPVIRLGRQFRIPRAALIEQMNREAESSVSARTRLSQD